jgi:beta-glucosidase/6-phospho-beta-glucosidase/beta-galactosidase
MIRKVAFGKALFAGAAGAVAWEAFARLWGLLFGTPLFDLVYLLGTLFVGDVQAWIWWPLGMIFHLLVGGIWAVFYAYFFWSAFKWPPVAQGTVFALLPIVLATVVMRPQLELMHPLVASGQLPFSGLYGLSGDWRAVAGLVLGHLAWGATMGALYVRPVGRSMDDEKPMAKPPPSRSPRPPRRISTSRPIDVPSSFLFATGIECSYPTIEGGRWRMDEMEITGHYRHWRTDFELVRELGLRHLRYGPPLHLIYTADRRYDWAWLDEIMATMRRLEIVPIIDLCHFGVPGWLENFQNRRVPEALAAYAAAFAERYRWVRFYTPVNEIYISARRSALEGAWNEQLRSEIGFVTASCNLAKASVLMRQAIVNIRPDAVFVNNESSEFYQPCCPDPEIQRIADFENERRFLPMDLIHARPVGETMRSYLRDNGLGDVEYEWFMRQKVPDRSIIGIDYYWSNEKLVNAQGQPEVLGELFGWYVIASQYYERYRRPLMHTEANLQDAREAPHWLWRQWHNVELLRRNGVPVIGFTWYSLIDQVDWDIGLDHPLGNVNPLGLFDLNRDPRPVALSYRELLRMHAHETLSDPHLINLLAGDKLTETNA